MNDSGNDDASLRRILLLGLTPLVIVALLCLSFSLCIQLSRSYSNWRLKQQSTIVQCSEHCLIVSNPSVDHTNLELFPRVI